MKARWSFVSLFFAFSSVCSSALAAPPEAQVSDIHLLHFASSVPHASKAIRLTKELENRLLRSRDVRFVNSNRTLLKMLPAAKCGKEFGERSTLGGKGYDALSDTEIDEPCEIRMSIAIGGSFTPVERYLWGWFYRTSSGQEMVTTHLWQRGKPDKKTTVVYTENSPERVAERIYLRLVESKPVGDVHLVVDKSIVGDLFVNGAYAGTFDATYPELTLLAGPTEVEIRNGTNVIARGQGNVISGQLERVVLSPVRASAVAPKVVILPAPSVDSRWKWIAGGVGVAGLAGAGVFFALNRSTQSTLDDTCGKVACPPREQDLIDRGKLYGGLSLVSLGVGALAGGLSVYWFAKESRQEAPAAAKISSSVQSIPGGASVSLRGAF